MAGVDCTVYLIVIEDERRPDDVLKLLVNDDGPTLPLVKGCPHGWVHSPQNTTKGRLVGDQWDLFLLTERSTRLSPSANKVISALLSIEVTITKAQHDQLRTQINKIPTPILDTPPLPQEWRQGGIPQSAIDFNADTNRDLRSGELKLDEKMAHFLSTTLPLTVRNRPVSLFNLFKYTGRDSSVHDAYMEGFKEEFGGAAGATVKFMGPVNGGLEYQGPLAASDNKDTWQDANLVQYDTIWHYAYMLSTEVYQKLNKQKMDGLEDTCILCISEIEVLP